MGTLLDNGTGNLLDHKVEVERRQVVAPDPFPFAYAINARASRPLSSWQQLDDLLSMIGITADLSFLSVDRVDGSERWAQAIGHRDEVIVELGLPDCPMRAAWVGGSPAPHRVVSSGGTVVMARRGELWTSAEATELIRAWLESATLGNVGAELRTPDDWR